MSTSWKTVPPEEAKAHPLYGVRNWLAVFAFGVLLSLLREVGSLSGEAYKAGLTLSQLLAVDHPAITFAKIVLAINVVVVSVIYWMLFTKHPKFRPVASGLLLVAWPVVVLVGVMNPFDGLGEAIAMSLFPWAISCAVWVAYLNRSRRVRVTYEHAVRADSPPQQAFAPRPETVRPSIPPPQTKAPTAPFVHAITPTPTDLKMSQNKEEDSWSQALREFEGPSRRTGLWAKAFAETDGDEPRAKAIYLRERARQLLDEAVQQEKAQREAPAYAEQQEIARCTAILSEAGYRVTSRSTGWEIREPLGGRQKIGTLADLSQYANERRQHPRDQ